MRTPGGGRLKSGPAAADMPEASWERAAARRTREAEDDTLLTVRVGERASEMRRASPNSRARFDKEQGARTRMKRGGVWELAR